MTVDDDPEDEEEADSRTAAAVASGAAGIDPTGLSGTLEPVAAAAGVVDAPSGPMAIP